MVFLISAAISLFITALVNTATTIFFIYRLSKSFNSCNRRSFRFLELPRELRDRIYEVALQDARRDFWFFDRPPALLLFRRTRKPTVALLSVSKQIREEALPVFWSSCHLDFVIKYSSRHAFHNFIRNLRPSTRRFLLKNRDVFIRVVFDKTSDDYVAFKENLLLGTIGVLCERVIAGDSPVSKWLILAEKAGSRNLRDMARPEVWSSQPCRISVQQSVFLKFLTMMERVGVETAEMLRLQVLHPDGATE